MTQTDPEVATARVVRLGQSGDGVVETTSGPLYVPGVLPGETIELIDGKPGARCGEPSPDRRQRLLCPHVGRCGGCTLQHIDDAPYRAWKAALLAEALRRAGLEIEPEPLVTVPLNSRRRAVLAARRDGATAVVGFHGRRSHDIEPLTACAILTPAIVASLPALARVAAGLLAADAEARITVIDTPSGLDVAFDTARTDLSPAENQRVAGIATAGRFARLSVAGNPFLIRQQPVLQIAGAALVPPPGAFLQAVAEAEAHMGAIIGAALGKARRTADLFSGLGTFTFGMARRASVLAVDGDKALIAALATAARATPGLKPIETRVRDLFQDPLSPRELSVFDAVVFDPPRAGAKAQAEALARSDVPVIVAVSCNLETLVRDLGMLVAGGYALKSVAPVDQFLFTPHLEAVAVLRKPKRRG